MLRHSATYAFANLATNLASLLLLPLYTRYLSSVEYGVMAILDLTINLLTMLVTAGMAPGVTRWSAEAPTRDEQRKVWGTAIAYVAVVGAATLVLGQLLSDRLAVWTLGSAESGYFYRILFPTLFMNVLGTMGATYLIAMKRSTLSTVTALGRLLAAIGLNVYLIAGLGWGIEGFLYGNLAVGTVFALGLVLYALRATGLGYSGQSLRRMLVFGLPFVPANLCAALLHEGNRLILQRYVTLADVGVFSLGYKIAMMANAAVLLPFAMAWAPIVYEVRRRDDAPETYATVMRLFTYVLLLGMLALAVFARELIQILAGPEFQDAYRVIPLVALGYVFFSMHEHFKVPVLLTDRTREIPLVYAVTVLFALASNLALIPWWGYMGAAAASTATFMFFALVAWLRYRRYYAIPFAFRQIGLALLGAVALFLIGERVPAEPLWAAVPAKAGLVVAFAAGLALAELGAGARPGAWLRMAAARGALRARWGR
jgi:O-antigen/teichoic acid export membrane protein